MSKHLRKAQKGFTLIELLIVVAIIGILAAIAIPNLITAQRRARYSRAAADTKSIITQAMVVTSDNNKVVVAGAPLGLGLTMPQALWDGSAPNGTIYMAKVTDAWASPAFYPFGEAACAGGTIGPGCVSYGSHTVGGDLTNGNGLWAGAVAIAVGTDDLGNGTVTGCSFDPVGVKISNPC